MASRPMPRIWADDAVNRWSRRPPATVPSGTAAISGPLPRRSRCCGPWFHRDENNKNGYSERKRVDAQGPVTADRGDHSGAGDKPDDLARLVGDVSDGRSDGQRGHGGAVLPPAAG
jgi:hypothetical protein